MAEAAELEVAVAGYIDLLAKLGSRWTLSAAGDLSDDYDKTKLVASLTALGNPFDADEVEREFGIERLDGRASMIQLGRILMESLMQDVEGCLDAAERETFVRCIGRIVDIGETNAICAHQDIHGRPLPGYVILVNQGLYFCLKLLVTAQVYEDLQGDMAEYRRSGAKLFDIAVDLLLTQRPDDLNVGAVYTGDPKIDGYIEAFVSLGSTLLMQFVILHEIGHAHLGHGKILGAARLQALAAAGSGPEPGEADAHHEAEFEADAFAWRALARRADTVEKNLGNLYCIRLLFGFLDAVEARIGRPLSGRHPPPMVRAERITALFAAEGMAEDHRMALEQQARVIRSWQDAGKGQ